MAGAGKFSGRIVKIKVGVDQVILSVGARILTIEDRGVSKVEMGFNPLSIRTLGIIKIILNVFFCLLYDIKQEWFCK